jgi:hypothetical protein
MLTDGLSRVKGKKIQVFSRFFRMALLETIGNFTGICSAKKPHLGRGTFRSEEDPLSTIHHRIVCLRRIPAHARIGLRREVIGKFAII